MNVFANILSIEGYAQRANVSKLFVLKRTSFFQMSDSAWAIVNT